MNNIVKYVFWNGTGWTTMQVGPQGNTWHALDLNLALSDSDIPHICFWKSASSNMGKIAYAYYDGTDWAPLAGGGGGDFDPTLIYTTDGF